LNNSSTWFGLFHYQVEQIHTHIILFLTAPEWFF